MRKLRPGKIKYTAGNYLDCKGQSTVSDLYFSISESPASKSGWFCHSGDTGCTVDQLGYMGSAIPTLNRPMSRRRPIEAASSRMKTGLGGGDGLGEDEGPAWGPRIP